MYDSSVFYVVTFATHRGKALYYKQQLHMSSPIGNNFCHHVLGADYYIFFFFPLCHLHMISYTRSTPTNGHNHRRLQKLDKSMTLFPFAFMALQANFTFHVESTHIPFFTSCLMTLKISLITITIHIKQKIG